MYHTTSRDGITEINPTDEHLKELLLSVGEEEGDESAPDVWLTHLETGWCISVFPGGYVTLENNLRPVPEREMEELSNQRIFSLWKLLAAGDIENLMDQPWSKK
ncbi:hypothetical protein [Ruficoccus sp. ZRK36]|uniref:hypothetical protein n=1 Tax=Ruficoccus sp. ZRK36 TaxID=2866311 RepID=UPI001C7332AD|nr:hypothetical protein [Ruficoccus sp. ZRK36]QYY34460.1 hypothetical protein K0V07_09070 [Ruficoccus sp. ZRK36]